MKKTELIESRREFISRMSWLVSEISTSDKGSLADIMKLLEFHLNSREVAIKDKAIQDFYRYTYENAEGSKARQLLNFIEIYANQKK